MSSRKVLAGRVALGPVGVAGQAWRDAAAVLDRHAALPLGRLVPQLAAGLVALVVYVPVHEALHALACVAVGGTVTELEIAPIFGGRILEAVFPVVSADTVYAGRLSGFDVGGSTLRLVVIDLAPYVLTVFPGVPLLLALRGTARAWLVPGAMMLALAPWISVPGDYYEAGSAMVTAALAAAGADWTALRSDDLVLLVGTLWRAPASLGVGGAGDALAAAAVVVMSLGLGLVLAGLTYAAGRAVGSATGDRAP